MKSKKINPTFGAGTTLNEVLAHLRTRLQEDQNLIVALEGILDRLTADVEMAERKMEEHKQELKKGTAKKT